MMYILRLEIVFSKNYQKDIAYIYICIMTSVTVNSCLGSLTPYSLPRRTQNGCTSTHSPVLSGKIDTVFTGILVVHIWLGASDQVQSTFGCTSLQLIRVL